MMILEFSRSHRQLDDRPLPIVNVVERALDGLLVDGRSHQCREMRGGRERSGGVVGRSPAKGERVVNNPRIALE